VPPASTLSEAEKKREEERKRLEEVERKLAESRKRPSLFNF
jgi:hypothetical protein